MFPRWRAASRTDHKSSHNPQEGRKGLHMRQKHSHGGIVPLGQACPPRHTHPGLWLAAWTQLECTGDLPVLSAK